MPLEDLKIGLIDRFGLTFAVDVCGTGDPNQPLIMMFPGPPEWKPRQPTETPEVGDDDLESVSDLVLDSV